MLVRALEVAPASARAAVHELLRDAGGEGERFARSVASLVHDGVEAARAEVRRGRNGMGCERCIETGYVGRTAIYEILTISEAVRERGIARAGASVIREVALEGGMRTLRVDGARKVAEGETTVEEVLRVTQLDMA